MKPVTLLTTLTVSLLLLSCSSNNDDYDATGSFEATEIIVSSQANGRILTLNLNEGDQLQQGQMVGVIDSTQLHLQKMSLLSNARGVRAQQPDIRKQTASIQEQIKTLEREKARVQRLLASNAANQKQLDDQLEKTRIISPIAGTVLNRYAEAGELATMGTPLFKIADTGTMDLRAYVTNDQLSRIKLNNEVTVRVDDGEGNMKSYKGKISWISSKSEFTPKTIQTKNERANLVYALKIAVPNDGFLKIGMYGEVKF